MKQTQTYAALKALAVSRQLKSTHNPTTHMSKSSKMIFVRVTSAGEVYQGSAIPKGNPGTFVAKLLPGQSVSFRATVKNGTARLFSSAAGWPGSVCGPYIIELLGAIRDKSVEDAGLWFKPPAAGILAPNTVKFTFTGEGLLKSEAGNRCSTIDLAQLARRNKAGEIIEDAEHYIALQPNESATVEFAFQEGVIPAAELSLAAS